MQLGGAFGVRPPPARQQQVTHTVRRNQVPRDQTAQKAGATGDQDRAVRVEYESTVIESLLGMREGGRTQTGHKVMALSHSQLRLTQGGRPAERTPRGLIAVKVDKHELPRVLRLRGADQAPHRRLG